MRQRAAESDVVIVNHHLLCADAAVRQSEYGEVIPSCSYAILDEAHQIEDVATQYFGLAASNYRIDDLARDVDRAVGSAQVPDRDVCRSALKHAAERLRDCARMFFAALQAMRFDVPGVGGADSRVRVGGPQMAKVGGPGRGAHCRGRGARSGRRARADVPEDVLAAGRRAAEIRSDLAFLLRADDPGFVYYLEVRGRGVFLRASPIDVSAIVRELLLDRMKATVLTSATLTVDGSFDYIREPPRHPPRGANCASPRNSTTRRRSILYLPKRMPDPALARVRVARWRDRWSRSSSGPAAARSSSSPATPTCAKCRRSPRREIEYPILVHGTAPRSALLRDFKATPNAVLLATSSFWQGVDVVGEALSCVIIDKLPFASPGDPITSARIDAIAARGGSAFGEYQIPLAILALQQGLGRLLRHRQDRGVLAVLDPRLRTMGYGRRFLASLPPAPVTCELDDIEAFFAAESDPRTDAVFRSDRAQ